MKFYHESDHYTFGQIAPHKGIDLLLKGFQRLSRDSAELRIYGAADQSPTYMNMLESLAEGRAVHFMGTFAMERMAEVLREMDLLSAVDCLY